MAFHCFYIVTFNDAGEIIQIETKRYMDEVFIEGITAIKLTFWKVKVKDVYANQL